MNAENPHGEANQERQMRPRFATRDKAGVLEFEVITAVITRESSGREDVASPVGFRPIGRRQDYAIRGEEPGKGGRVRAAANAANMVNHDKW